MKVKRIIETETKVFMVGDKISINLQGYGEFTATAHEITDKGTLFIFDDCVCERQMNETGTNEGGFKKTYLCRWMNTELLRAFLDEIRSRMVADENGNYLTVPTYGQIFGKDFDDEWDQENIDIDQREQLQMMSKRKNRIADLNGKWFWYWLQNKIKSSSAIALVNGNGAVNAADASNSAGVRPTFLIQ